MLIINVYGSIGAKGAIDTLTVRLWQLLRPYQQTHVAFTVCGSSRFFVQPSVERISHIFMHSAANSVHIISDR